MKRVLKGLGEFILLGMIVMGPLMSLGIVKTTAPVETPITKVMPLILSIILAFVWFKFFYLKRKIQKKDTRVSNGEELSTILKDNGLLTISKKIDIVWGQSLYIDNINKRWGIIQVGKNNKVIRHKIFSYSELTKYEVEKEKELKTQGRTGSTILGGVTFGVVGAVVGSSRSKKTTEKIKDVTIHLVINSLETPTVSIICGDVSKANEVSGVLEYILTNK